VKENSTFPFSSALGPAGSENTWEIPGSRLTRLRWGLDQVDRGFVTPAPRSDRVGGWGAQVRITPRRAQKKGPRVVTAAKFAQLGVITFIRWNRLVSPFP